MFIKYYIFMYYIVYIILQTNIINYFTVKYFVLITYLLNYISELQSFYIKVRPFQINYLFNVWILF